MHQSSAHALVGLGGDPHGFEARPFVAAQAEAAGLVLTMTREQRHRVLQQAPRAMRWTFTLPEAAALMVDADLEGLSSLTRRDRVRELAGRLNAGRRQRPSRAEDDILDPIGASAGVHRQVAAHVADFLRPLAGVLLAECLPVPEGAASASFGSFPA
jgi:protein-tyrosine phosphatase